MKILIYKIGEAIIILFGVLILGLLIPMLLTALATVITDVKFTEGFRSEAFWIFTVIGWICAGVYINDVVKEIK